MGNGVEEGGSGWDAIFKQTGGALYVKGGLGRQGASEKSFKVLEMMKSGIWFGTIRLLGSTPCHCCCVSLTDIYVLKCQEIGETPSSKVMAQMMKPHANMAHCKLGRQGSEEQGSRRGLIRR